MAVQPLEEERVEETQDLVQTMSLLDLPDSLLHLVLNQLNAALDLAAAAATCSTLRAVINSSRWQFISAFETHKWTPGLTGCLRWAAAKCPQVGAVPPPASVIWPSVVHSGRSLRCFVPSRPET